MLQSKDASSELINLIYGSLFGECNWQDFLDRVAQTSPNGKAALHYHDLASPVAHVPYVSGFSRTEVDQFSSHFAAVNPWIPRLSFVPVGQGVCGDEIFPREDLLKSEFYNDWLKGQAQCETSIGVSIIREETRTFVLSTCTSSADPDFNKEAAGRYTILAPHLKRAFDFIRKRDLLAPERQTTQTLFDSIGVGLIYVSEQGRARQWNKSAEALMAAGFPVHVAPSGKLELQCERSAAVLDFLTSRKGVQSRPHTAIAKGKDKASYRITLLRLQTDAFTEFLEGPTVAVIVEPLVATPLNERRDFLMEAYKLTATEIRIASSIASGHSPKEVAIADHISYETVRTHLRNIYSKLGVNSRVGLVALLMR
ncbi:helix-turn-helix transcriptional regulator (plasmid) [Rhizobium leguminosarum]|uniref:LuxR C-terminal-related transcriptional regulator n=1 Tax=Rhizobium TaxID=379 RepID=UPI00102FB1D1|nr:MULTISPECIES: helix-turn-helix transcriptional regulator [Rhizobium]MDV4156448.1 helix-turn-helix transcriptional regulator [Rhizobium brockwellii]TAX27816.1 helix-turn-helix transcriptional regulator [Rhizobium leguminosarum]TAX88027.1 helix-turn-helix transcriptional regulator [Rhizobium leguminosarum]TAY91337.1 helix-turn-helix transcriptional regulator [Rhizobium leguminosarum]TAZ04802.1 helix-turn-helix transcriptional regulator [Rhizobium leguminosarum]